MAAARRRWPKPADLLKHLGVDEPRDLDVEAIAHYCGATVICEQLHGCAARLVANGDRAVITIDRDAHPSRWRFSAAHELGHWMLDRRRKSFACTETMLGNREASDGVLRAGLHSERRANRWAADLLMPEHLFAPAFERRELTFLTARSLAREFNTSLLATALRMVRFYPGAAMIVWSRLGQRYKWFRRNRSVPEALWPRPEPGEDTVAYSLLRDTPDRGRPRFVKWAEWFELSYPALYYLVEDAIRLRNGDVLSLLVWTDETPLYDLDFYL